MESDKEIVKLLRGIFDVQALTAAACISLVPDAVDRSSMEDCLCDIIDRVKG